MNLVTINHSKFDVEDEFVTLEFTNNIDPDTVIRYAFKVTKHDFANMLAYGRDLILDQNPPSEPEMLEAAE